MYDIDKDGNVNQSKRNDPEIDVRNELMKLKLKNKTCNYSLIIASILIVPNNDDDIPLRTKHFKKYGILTSNDDQLTKIGQFTLKSKFPAKHFSNQNLVRHSSFAIRDSFNYLIKEKETKYTYNSKLIN